MKWLGCLVVASIVTFAAAAPASAETRSLKLYFIHTKERADITYKRNGRYVQSGLDQINRFLRDWRRNEPARMDPKLLDLLWEVYRSVGGRDYIHVVSAYRSPATNAALRSRSSGVAEKSQHMLGKAIDFYIPGVALSKLRAAGFKAEGGGVGYYPKSGAPFVHLDVGNVRSWPRMSRGELMALFPDGRTIHMPTDGKPLPGFKQALASYEARKRSGSSVQIASSGSGSSGSSRTGGGLLAALFRGGGGADEEEDSSPVLTAAAPASQAPAPAQPAAAVQAAPEPTKPETIIAALPARDVPLPGVAPRPLVDIGASASAPLIAGLPSNAAPQQEAEPVAEIAFNAPLPSRRPDYTPAEPAAVQVASSESPAADLPVAAIAAERPRGGGSEAITEMLAMTAADARADVIINPPLPALRPRLTADVAGSRQVASVSAEPSAGDIFVLASLPATDAPSARTLDSDVRGETSIAAIKAAPDARQVASLSASPRVAVIGREAGSDVTAALASGVRTTAKSSKPLANEARRNPRSVPVPVQHELTRWAFQRDVTVATAGGSKKPAMAHDIVRRTPSTVYTAGFQQEAPDADPNRFTGKAVTFLSVAKFATN